MMSSREKIYQALLFEALLFVMLIPVVYFLGDMVTHIEAEKAFVVTLVASGGALIINYFYNTGFDRFFGHQRIERSMKIRTLHTVGFELCLLSYFLPFLMWYLQISFMQALMMDMLMMGIALVYTYLFHLIYDKIRYRLTQDNSASS